MKFKNYLSLILVFAVIFSMPVNSFASDYSGHWAEQDINYLINKNIVSGDANGIRPDDKILRAEFIKVINQLFDIPDANIENTYLDLTSDKWYYNEILKATSYGILTGDGTGYCYPENEITRAEASVVLARVLKLDTALSDTSFNDDLSIPQWAKPYISTLVKTGIINGYSDNTFKALNNITRAEAFSLLVRAEGKLGSNSGTEDTFSQSTPQSPVISAGGGGGGGGGNKESKSELTAPVIKRIDALEKKVYWSTVAKATGYEIVLTITTEGKSGSETLNLKKTEADISNEINSLIGDNQEQVETFSVKVKAKNNSSSSSYSKAESFSIVCDVENAVSIPEITTDTEIENDTEKVSLKWDAVADALKYELYVDFDDGNGYILVNNDNSTKVYLTDYVALDNLKESYNVKFKVYSANPELVDSQTLEKSVSVSLYGGKDGEYDIILSKRHFLNIEKNPSGKYILKADLNLGEYTPFEFSGTFKGDSAENLRNIDLNITDTSGNAGLFTIISGSVNISDITLTGSVTGNMVAGGIAGGINAISNKGDASIKNIVNYANITSTSTATTSYAGGIIGNAYGDSSGQYLELSYLVNYGDIKGGIAAGVMGYLRGKASYCANHGNITATRQGAGGILGTAYASVDTSYNTGDVQGATYAGGIIASTNIEQASISNSFNTGNVTSTGGNACGILGQHSTNTARKIYIYNCYNIGTLSSTQNTGEIYIHDLSLDNLISSNNYYISDTHTEDSDDGYKGTYPVTAQDLGNLSKLSKEEDGVLRQFSTGIWQVTNNQYNYSYPQLIGNLYKMKSRELEVPVIYDVTNNSENKVFVTVKGEANTVSYTLKVFDQNTELESYTLNGGAESTVEITEALTGYNKDYTIKVVANGDGVIYLSKDGLDYTYRHIEYIAPPLGDGTEQNPYIISRIENFKYINTYGQDKAYKITCDLDFTGDNKIWYTVLGETSSAAFSGTLIGDKNGEKPVIKLDITNDGVNGFIRYLTGNVENFIIEGSITGTAEIGAVAGNMKGGSIKNIENRASVISDSTSTALFAVKAGGIVGGIAKGNDVIIENCENYGTVTPHTFGQYVGGIAGFVDNDVKVTVKNCGNYGNVQGYSNVGGVIGFVTVATTKVVSVLLSYNCGDITGQGETAVAKDNSYIGGILGNGPATIDQCFNSGKVSGCNNTGGIAGGYQTRNVNIALTNSYNAGVIKPLATTGSYRNNGGLTGAANLSGTGEGKITIKNNYNGGSVEFDRAHWALYVSAPADATISNNYYSSALRESLAFNQTLSDPTVTTVLPVEIEAQNMSSEASFEGFDFEDIWEIKTEDDYKYPQLKSNVHKVKGN